MSLLERWTRLSPHSLLGAAVRLPLRLVPRDRPRRVRGGLNRGLRWIPGSSVHGCWLGTYEPEMQRMFAQRVRAGMCVWDVGANAGFFTLAAARLVGAQGQVHAFEPFAEAAHHLLRHVALNPSGNVTIVQAALSERGGLLGFAPGRSSAMGKVDPEASTYRVPALTADAYAELNPSARPQLLKIDVEGGEAALLRGAQHLLSQYAPELLLSLHGAEQAAQCEAILVAHGYYLRPLPGGDIHAMREGGK